MAHPLEDVIRGADRFVLIGDSEKGRFPAMSFNSYTKVNKPFYCLDLGGLTESRGGSPGKKVYTSVDEVPDDHADLAIIWVTASRLKDAIDAADALGCKRLWFSFKSCEAGAIEYAREKGLEIVEIGRCPVYYMDRMIPVCKAHTLLVKASGSYRKPPQTDPTAKRREMF